MKWPAYPAILYLALGASGCALLSPATTVPVETQWIGDAQGGHRVYVMLPGIRGRGTAFAREGMLGAADDPGSAAVAVDLHWGYYKERSATERLMIDVIQPLAGRRVVLAGISLGGFGTLLTASLPQPPELEALVLLSPYLGEPEYLERVQAGEFADQAGDDDRQRGLNAAWRYLLDPQRQVPVYLGFGRDDRFTPFYRELQKRAPANLQIDAIDGGHDWPTWRRLWSRALRVLSPALNSPPLEDGMTGA